MVSLSNHGFRIKCGMTNLIDILGEEFPNAQTEMLPGGHAPQLVSMQQFMKILTKFWASTAL